MTDHTDPWIPGEYNEKHWDRHSGTMEDGGRVANARDGYYFTLASKLERYLDEASAELIWLARDGEPLHRSPGWLYEPYRVTGDALEVFGVIAGYANEDDIAWPSVQMIASKMEGMSESSVSRYIKELEAIGAIRRKTRYLPSGQRCASLLHLQRDDPRLDPTTDGPAAAWALQGGKWKLTPVPPTVQ